MVPANNQTNCRCDKDFEGGFGCRVCILRLQARQHLSGCSCVFTAAGGKEAFSGTKFNTALSKK
jgi:hypothetical protein